MKTLEERFWAKVEPEPNSGCWLWTAGTANGGYGYITLGGRGSGKERAHRLSAKWADMDIEGKCVLHRCDVPACVNPDHLFVGTRTDNNRDMTAKGRHGRTGAPGERNAQSKLTALQVMAIRVRWAMGTPQAALAREYGVTRTVVGMIVHRKAWTHVP